MTIWRFSIASVLLVSLVSLVGLFTLSMNETRMRRLAGSLVSFATGALLADAFIHLIPESFARAQDPLPSPLLILAGCRPHHLRPSMTDRQIVRSLLQVRR